MGKNLSRMRFKTKQVSLYELVKMIEKEAYNKAFEKYGDKVNKIAAELKVSKSVYYRIANDTVSF